MATIIHPRRDIDYHGTQGAWIAFIFFVILMMALIPRVAAGF